MPEHTYKLIEIVGSSTESVDRAIHNGIEKAAKTLQHMDWYEVVQIRGHIVDGRVAHHQVTLKIGFRLE